MDWRKEVFPGNKAGFTPKDYDEKSRTIRMVQTYGDMSSMWNEQSSS